VEVVSKLDLRPLFVQILVLAQAIGLLKLGRVSLDGTKVKANASKHSALVSVPSKRIPGVPWECTIWSSFVMEEVMDVWK
ncbi:MAG: hypothetical protein ACRD1R_12615, partial [Acidobacteriota bacterium]